jgi:transcription termination/antitermination protein NusA
MALTGIAANRLELLQIADAVAREKSIDKEIVIAAIEEAMTKAARARYGAEHDIRVGIDQKTGEMTILRYITVVEEVENQDNEVTLAEAKDRGFPEPEIGKS